MGTRTGTVELPKKKLSIMWYRIARNIDEDYLEMFLVTSQAAGLQQSEGRPMGAGKSTFAIWAAYRAFAYEKGLLSFDFDQGEIVDEASHEERIAIMKDIVSKYVAWSIEDLLDIVKGSEARLPAVVFDDVQLSCPAWQHIPPKKRELMEELTVARPLVANIIMTAPSISDIARPLRRNITWEVIVPERGVYEIHFIAKKRDFYNPTDDRSRLWYDVSGNFEVLPSEVYEAYEKRRVEIARRRKPGEEEEKKKEESEREPRKETKPLTFESIAQRILELYDNGVPVGRIASNLHVSSDLIRKVVRERRGRKEETAAPLVGIRA
jgi:hypothetical protein